MEKYRVLIVEDESEMRLIIKMIVNSLGYEADLCKNGNEAIKAIKSNYYDLVITDIRMEGKSGLEVLKYAKQNSPYTLVILITGFATVDNVVQALKMGVDDYLQKPFSHEELVFTIEKALKQKKIEEENAFLREKIELIQEANQLIGKSPAFENIINSLKIISQNEGTVLIMGESGTGKDLVARAIHNAGKRRDEKFIAINCGSLNDQLLSSELFGHEKGAFTGAVTTKKGLIEVANGGTLLLDEIGETSLTFQILLLRYLQEKTFRRVGGTSDLSSDVRVIAATNKNLNVETREGRFRSDLFYRLNVIPIIMPPLRERKEDIPLLVQTFALKYSRKYNLPCPKFSASTYSVLSRHDWPGNIRELENIVEHAVIMQKNEITINGVTTPHFMESVKKSDKALSLKEMIEQITREAERFYLEQTLFETDGHRGKAAEILGISRRNLQYKIKRYNL